MTDRPGMLLDASCLINLYASGRLREIALTASHWFGVSDYVLEVEALYVWPSALSDQDQARAPISLSSLTDEGVIRVLSLAGPDEEATFVNLARYIDDGEAVTGSIAIHRGYVVATDDRKARRVLAEQVPPIGLIGTLELMKAWVDHAKITAAEAREALKAIQADASYVPSRRHPLFAWWKSIVTGN